MLVAPLMFLLAMQSAAPAAAPAPLPPDDSAPVVRTIEIRFPAQDRCLAGRSDDVSVLHTDEAEPTRQRTSGSPLIRKGAKDDFVRLWATGFLDDLSIDVEDEPYANGVVGKHIIYMLEEKQRVRLVEYTGSKVSGDIQDRGTAQGARTPCSAWTPSSMPAASEPSKGSSARCSRPRGIRTPRSRTPSQLSTVARSLAHVTFMMNEGAQMRVRQVTITGNRAVSSRTIRSQVKSGASDRWWLPAFLARPQPLP